MAYFLYLSAVLIDVPFWNCFKYSSGSLLVSRPEPVPWSPRLGGGCEASVQGPRRLQGDPPRLALGRVRGCQLAPPLPLQPFPPRPWGVPPNLNLLPVQLRHKWFCYKSVANRGRLPKPNFLLKISALSLLCFHAAPWKPGGRWAETPSALPITTDCMCLLWHGSESVLTDTARARARVCARVERIPCFNLLPAMDRNWNKINMRFIDLFFPKDFKNKQMNNGASLAPTGSLPSCFCFPASVTIVTGLIMAHGTISNYSPCQRRNEFSAYLRPQTACRLFFGMVLPPIQRKDSCT